MRVIPCALDGPRDAGPAGLKPRLKSGLVALFSWVYRAFLRAHGLGLARGLARRACELPPEGLAELSTAIQQAHRMDYERHAIYLLVTSEPEVRRLASAGKEPWTIAWIEQHVRPGEVLYDIGANVGAYALVAAKYTGGRARVFAFEPGCSSYASLCKNIVLNGCQESIVPLPVALAAETAMANFHYSSLLPGAALHTLGEAPSPAAFDQPVLAYRLDDLIAGFGLPMPDHIKLDVDGSEAAVLRGAVRVLGHPGLKTLMLELNEEETDVGELNRFLGGCGFRLASVARRPGTNSPAYGLFARDAAVAVA